MNEKIVSVIVPIYGVEKYLDKCVESIVNQTYKNLEIILVDDGSPDNCPTMCDEWAKRDDRIKVIHKENGGQASARNRALDVCTGNYISFIDSDDRILPNMYEDMIKAMEEDDADIGVCGNIVNSGFRFVENQITDKFTTLNTEEAVKAYFLKESIAPTVTNKLFASYIFKDIRFEEIRAKEDVMIVHELLHLAKKTILIPKAYYVIAIRNDSTEGSSFSEKSLLSLKAAKKRQAFVKEYYPHLCSEPKIRFNYIGALKNKCFQINRSFEYKNYKKVYEDLMKDMQREYDRLCSENVDGTADMLAEYKKVLDKPLLFRFIGIRAGCVRRIKRALRRGLNKFSKKNRE